MLLSAAVLSLLGWCRLNGIFAVTAGLLGLAWWILDVNKKAPAEPKPLKMAENNSVVRQQ